MLLLLLTALLHVLQTYGSVLVSSSSSSSSIWSKRTDHMMHLTVPTSDDDHGDGRPPAPPGLT